MGESSFFKPIKGEIERKNKVNKKVKPLTTDAYEKMAQKPMTLKDYWLSLRQSIQEKITSEELTQEEQETIKLLSELITPELMIEYRQILREFNGKANKTDKHPEREFIDVNEQELSTKIKSWIEKLIDEVKKNRKIEFDKNDYEELNAQCWLFFDALGNVMNTRSLERDVGEFYHSTSRDDIDDKEFAKQKSAFVKQLSHRYPLDKGEIGILVDVILSGKGENENYSPKILVETIVRLWDEYKLEENKGTVMKISLGYLISRGIASFAPSLFQNVIERDRFNVAVFLEFFGLNQLSNVIDVKTRIELAKMMNEVNHRINEKITNSLFFREFEFIHEKSLGEIYATLERGKKSTEGMLRDTISQIAPALAGIVMSLAFLSKINPILGAIGMGSLPVMYKVAKKQNERIWPMYEQEQREGEKIATHLGAIKSGFEEVKISSEVPTIAAYVKEQMDIKDTLSLQRFVEETKMRLKSAIPFNVSTVVAAGVGGAFQEIGMISGGAVLSNMMYANQLNAPVHRLVDLYFNKFSRYIQDIRRMDEIFGQYETLDLPEGEKEKDRIPISKLKNFDVSIKHLRYKNVLRDITIDIAQGEFITITGESGVGKSTLLRNMVGLYKADSGAIKIDGVEHDCIKNMVRNLSIPLCHIVIKARKFLMT